MSIKNLNLFNKFNSINLSNKLSFKTVKTSVGNVIPAMPEEKSLLGSFSNKNLNNIELQDSYIVNNLLLQKLILSKYHSTDLRFKFLNIRLFLNLVAKNNIAPNTHVIASPSQVRTQAQDTSDVNTKKEENIFKFKKAIIKLLHTPHPNHEQMTQINKKPNLRNLRLILKRFFINSTELTEAKKLNFNYKQIKTSKEIYLLSNLNKYNQSSITSINNKFNDLVSSNKTPNLKFLVSCSAYARKAKEIRKIRKISKNLIFNLAYRIRRYKFKKLGYFYFKSNSAKILSKVLPTVENANSFYYYFNQNKFNSYNKININKVFKRKNLNFPYKTQVHNASGAVATAHTPYYNRKSGTIINISYNTQEQKNSNFKFKPANASKKLRIFMRKNFINFMVQNYIYNSMWHSKDGVYSHSAALVTHGLINEKFEGIKENELHSAHTHGAEIKNSYNIYQVRSINNIIRSNTSYARNKMAFLTLSNRLPGYNNSTSLSLYGNIYKVIERNTNNYKFKLYPYINYRFNPSILNFAKIAARAKCVSDKNAYARENSYAFSSRSVLPSLPSPYLKKSSLTLRNETPAPFNSSAFIMPISNYAYADANIRENKNIINSTVNYWLLEQEKQNKRTFMYPHLAMSTREINKDLSYQSRVNFLKINQLSFLYSEGDFNIKLINEFLVKILHLDRLNFFKYHNTFYFINHFTDFIKSYKKKFKKSHIKKFLSEDIKNLNHRRFKKYLFYSLFNFGLNFDIYLNYIYNLEMRDTQNRTFRIELKKARNKKNKLLRLLNKNLNKRMFY